jgi:hypothetical protein
MKPRDETRTCDVILVEDEVEKSLRIFIRQMGTSYVPQFCLDVHTREILVCDIHVEDEVSARTWLREVEKLLSLALMFMRERSLCAISMSKTKSPPGPGCAKSRSF